MSPEQTEDQENDIPPTKVVFSSGTQADDDDNPSPLDQLGNWAKQEQPMQFLGQSAKIAGTTVGSLGLLAVTPVGAVVAGGLLAHTMLKKHDWQKNRAPSVQQDAPQITQKGPSFSHNPS